MKSNTQGATYVDQNRARPQRYKAVVYRRIQRGYLVHAALGCAWMKIAMHDHKPKVMVYSEVE